MTEEEAKSWANWEYRKALEKIDNGLDEANFICMHTDFVLSLNGINASDAGEPLSTNRRLALDALNAGNSCVSRKNG